MRDLKPLAIFAAVFLVAAIGFQSEAIAGTRCHCGDGTTRHSPGGSSCEATCGDYGGARGDGPYYRGKIWGKKTEELFHADRARARQEDATRKHEASERQRINRARAAAGRRSGSGRSSIPESGVASVTSDFTSSGSGQGIFCMDGKVMLPKNPTPAQKAFCAKR